MQPRRQSRFIVIICLAASVLVSAAAAQPPSGAQPNAFQEVQLGNQALNQGRNDEAIQHFDKATDLLPTNAFMQLNLANALEQKYVPGDDKPGNVMLADEAIKHYQKAMELNASNISSHTAAKNIAYIYAQRNKFDEAKEYYDKAAQLQPNDPQPYYYTALIDWTLVSQFRKQERTRLGLKPAEFLADKDHKACIVVRGKNWSNVEDGIEKLNKALEIEPKYEEAITCMNLIYLERADVECDDPAARKSDLKIAAEWARKAEAAKQEKAAHPKKKDDDDDQ